MPTLKTDGLDEFVQQLQALGQRTQGIAKACVYDGAAVLKDAIVEGVNNFPVHQGGYTPGKTPLRVITEKDRDDLAACVGVSKIESDGLATSVSVSFDGYISRTEKKYPNGVPAAMIARSLEKGSSVRAKKPFVRPAVKKAKEAVLSAMQQALAERIGQTMKQEG